MLAALPPTAGRMPIQRPIRVERMRFTGWAKISRMIAKCETFRCDILPQAAAVPGGTRLLQVAS